MSEYLKISENQKTCESITRENAESSAEPPGADIDTSQNVNQNDSVSKHNSASTSTELQQQSASCAEVINDSDPSDDDYSPPLSLNVVLLDSDNELRSDRNDFEPVNEKSNGSLDRKRSHDSENTGSPKTKKTKIEDSLENNEDFISFNFDDEDDEDDHSVENYHSEKFNEKHSRDIEEDTTKLKTHSAFPWVLNHDHSKQKEIADWLNLEIHDFVKFMSPSREEILLRNKCIKRLKFAIENFWKDSHVYVFGSYASELYLPDSDIDFVINTDNPDSLNKKDNRASLYKLSSYLKLKKIPQSVEVVASAKVPIIKLVDKESRLNIDISFERMNGVAAAKTISKWVKTTPGLRELVMVLKHFLATRQLNNVRFGGIGGFTTICMVYTFLKLHPRLITNSIDPLKNLGVLLIEFFELYGRNFAYDSVVIIPQSPETGDPMYGEKRFYPQMDTGRNSYSLAIQDPNDPLNNISRGSFKIWDWRKAFNNAYSLLVDKCLDLNSMTYKQRLNESILGSIIKYKGRQREFVDERPLIKNIAFIDNQIIHAEKRKELTSENAFVDLTTDESDDDSDEVLTSDSEESSDEDETDNEDEDEKAYLSSKSNTVWDSKLISDMMGLDCGEDDDQQENEASVKYESKEENDDDVEDEIEDEIEESVNSKSEGTSEILEHAKFSRKSGLERFADITETVISENNENKEAIEKIKNNKKLSTIDAILEFSKQQNKAAKRKFWTDKGSIFPSI